MKPTRAPAGVHAHLRVRVHPGARVAGVAGRMTDGTWKLKVTAAPEAGRANRAVEALLADVLGVRGTQVKVTRGQSSRAKTVEIDGLDDAAVAARLDSALRAMGAEHGE